MPSLDRTEWGKEDMGGKNMLEFQLICIEEKMGLEITAWQPP